MFERSLSSLIKGLRSHRGRNEAKYVATLMEEINYEIRSGDMDVKAEAVLKLTYLQMLGYPPPNASFHMLEVMASPRFHLKQVGYLAASQCFTEDTDVLILATNLLKKDLRSSSPFDVAVALNGLSHIVTPDLAQHLAPEIITLLTHTRSSIRKKALLVLYSIILQYPSALAQSLPRLSEKLDDDDTGVVSATINIICELSRNDVLYAKTFLTLSPQFFHLLTNSTNNWMLIKIIKLFGVLTPLEPRLVKKLVPPISSIISTTPAMSLLYECIHTMIIGGMLNGSDGDNLAAICVEKLATFLDDEDQNLKYIALLALVKIIPTHSHLVAMHQEQIFEAMEDDDLSIRLRALDLVSGMAGRSNYKSIVEHQLEHLEPKEKVRSRTAASALQQNLLPGGKGLSTRSAPLLTTSYRLEIITRILNLGSLDTYSNVTDFEWYVDILIKLAYMANEAVGEEVCSQLIDVASRVRAVRPHAIAKLKQILEEYSPPQGSQGGVESEDFRLIKAAAWICGEYCQSVSYPPAIISLLLKKGTLQTCRSGTVSMVLHNVVKLLAWWMLELSKDWKDEQLKDLKELTKEIDEALQYWVSYDDVEVKERAVEYRQLLLILENDLGKYSLVQDEEASVPHSPAKGDGWVETVADEAVTTTKGPKSLLLLSPLFFGHTLGPVAKKAQSKVAVPASLDLDQWILEPGVWEVVSQGKEEDEDEVETEKKKSRSVLSSAVKKTSNVSQAETKENARLKAERLQRQKASPFYIGSKVDSRPKSTRDGIVDSEMDIDDIPIVQLQLDSVDVSEKKATKEGEGGDIQDMAIIQQEDEEMPEERSEQPVVKKKVAAKKNRKGKAVREESLT
ncbi:hypothetical protein CBS101457_006393 [Exobasidium rhododendri]|nr:hypothetical protein CBS101457_006393 [Exobasidium rhododendri]